jgi:hypothetical protein
MTLPEGFSMPEPTDGMKMTIRSTSRDSPPTGTDWIEAASGRVYRVSIKPINAVTLEPIVTLFYPGYGYLWMTVADFLSEETLPDGTIRPRFSEQV